MIWQAVRMACSNWSRSPQSPLTTSTSLDGLSDPADSLLAIPLAPGGLAVPESSNIEIAHKLAEHRDAEAAKKPWQDLVVEIVEAVLLGVVAVATAWSAYHAAKWEGHEAELYGRASTLRIEADELVTLGGQQRLLDVSTFNTWIQARNEGQDELAALYVRRFSREFKVAFDAWLKTNPFSNPAAPPGPSFMPEYRNQQILQGAAANQEARHVFDEGTAARKQSEAYTGTTVVFATVLFLVALSPRFQSRRVRFALLLLTGGLAVYALVTILGFPRL
jgi:hypothetical protein